MELKKPIVNAELLEFIMVKTDSWLYVLKDNKWDQKGSKDVFNKGSRLWIFLKKKKKQNKTEQKPDSNRIHFCRVVWQWWLKNKSKLICF